MTDFDVETELAKPHWIARVETVAGVDITCETYCLGARDPHPNCTEHTKKDR